MLQTSMSISQDWQWYCWGPVLIGSGVMLIDFAVIGDEKKVCCKSYVDVGFCKSGRGL